MDGRAIALAGVIGIGAVGVYYVAKERSKKERGFMTVSNPFQDVISGGFVEYGAGYRERTVRHGNQLCHADTCCPYGGTAQVWNMPVAGHSRTRFTGPHYCHGKGITPYPVVYGPGCGC